MNRLLQNTVSLVLLFLLANSLQAQFRGSNLAEFQYGNIPEVEPTDLASFYDQLNLSYRYKKFSVSTRVEHFSASHGEDTDYTKLSQYKASYSNKWVSLDAGHIYSSFGRGLLMRNYEIPASVYESFSYRVRYGFYKDMHGFSAKFKSKYVNIKILRGDILTVDLPPTLSENDRRTDLVEGGEIDGNFKNQTVGFIFMRHHNDGNKTNYASLYYNGNIKDLNLYGELAKSIDSLDNLSSFTNADAFGGYLGLNYSINSLGISLEYKNYQNFAIGNGVNDPPTLIKEHASKLLNRSTHVPLLLSETGYQAEIFYLFGNGAMLTLNNALSENKLATNSFIYREYYADFSIYATEKILAKTFIDYALDPLVNEPERYTGGTTIDIEHSKLSSTINFEAQYIKREPSVSENASNYLISYTISKSAKFSFSALLEISDDAYVLSSGESIEYYPSATATVHLGRKNKLAVFYGKRRGGPACNSGVCYDVLDFEGVEMRLNTRF